MSLAAKLLAAHGATSTQRPPGRPCQECSHIACQTQRNRYRLLDDPNLTNTEQRLILENPESDPYELLATVDDHELT